MLTKVVPKEREAWQPSFSFSHFKNIFLPMFLLPLFSFTGDSNEDYQPFNNNLDLNDLLQNVGDGLDGGNN